ncbi:MAG: dTMP kinase [Planctomycetaceae bacterium]|jgi:dTMP kinase|nr:dTMP kinase [Planctomycetaceae bacterium]
MMSLFISIDGGDSCGKSTQIAILANWLRQKNYDVFTCRDPGSTRLGEAIRTILLNRYDLDICRMSETLLFMAARAQMLKEIILPELKLGKIVLTDRFFLSTLVYQGYAGQIPIDDIEQIGKMVLGKTVPDIDFILDVPLEIAEKRRQNREKDRMEKMDRIYHKQVRQGFLTHAHLNHERFVVIDASQSVDTIAEKIRQVVEKKLEDKRKPEGTKSF